jgi:hypothetical protein
MLITHYPLHLARLKEMPREFQDALFSARTGKVNDLAPRGVRSPARDFREMDLVEQSRECLTVAS